MFRLPLIALAALSLITTAEAQRGGAGRNAEPPVLKHFNYETWEFDSQHAARGQASYSIYLPKQHDYTKNKDRKFPWILWLPGFGGPDDFQGRGGATTLDRLREQSKIPELALVVFRAPGGRGRTTYMNGEAIGNIEDLIVKDLLIHVESKFRVSSQREHRAVMGVSAGGFGAMKIALRHPGLFGAVATHSAAILPADPADLAGSAESTVMRYLRGGLREQLGDPIDPKKWAQQMPMGLVALKKPADLHGLQIYFDAGTDDHYGFFEPNQQLAAAMKKNGHKHYFRPVEEGGHAWSSSKMVENLEHSMEFAGLAISGKDAMTEIEKAAAKKKKADEGK
ncbi:MAG: enterochelin esterase-like enzyme [Planctomycetota bacterium]|jgi:enterochelin esterase-like enzyme